MNLACTVRRWHLSAISFLALALAFSGGASAEIKTIEQDGKRVFVNDEDTAPTYTVTKSGQRYSRNLVYWSNTEHRWKPVPVPTPGKMRAARSALAEVNEALASQPKSETSNGAVQPENPNYTRLAKAYNVTSEEIDAAITAAAERHDVDPDLVKALIKVESNFNPKAVSNKGAMGLMQLMPATARSLNVSNPFDPRQNVDAGVRHLKGLLQNFNGDVKLSLAAYNAGQGAVMRNGGRIPPYMETQNYVRRITTLYTGGLNVAVNNPVRRPIKVSRDERGILTFNNTD